MPTREFRVDDYGAPEYPELVLTTSAETLRERPELVARDGRATNAGYDDVEGDPQAGLTALLDAVPELDPGEQRRQLAALTDADAFRRAGDLDPATLASWARWDLEHGIVCQADRRHRGVSPARRERLSLPGTLKRVRSPADGLSKGLSPGLDGRTTNEQC